MVQPKYKIGDVVIIKIDASQHSYRQMQVEDAWFHEVSGLWEYEGAGRIVREGNLLPILPERKTRKVISTEVNLSEKEEGILANLGQDD